MKHKITFLLQQLKCSKRRFYGTLLVLIGVLLGVISRLTTGSTLPDFYCGLLMGLSVGILLVGILFFVLSLFES